MEIKAFLKKLSNLTYRLFFYCLGYVVLYYCLKYLIFIPYELNENADKLNCMIITLIQLAYWILTFIAEQISNKINQGEWDLQHFNRLNNKVKLFMLLYIMLTITFGYFFINSFFGPEYSDQFNFNTSDKSNQLSKIVYGTELGISLCLSAYLIYIYKIMSNANNQPQTHQRFLPNIESINSNDNRQEQLLQLDDNVQADQVNNNQQQQQQPVRRFSLSYSFAQQEGNFFYDNEKNCVICLETCLENEKIIELPCLHTYHSDCIRQQPARLCPTCRAPY